MLLYPLYLYVVDQLQQKLAEKLDEGIVAHQRYAKCAFEYAVLPVYAVFFFQNLRNAKNFVGFIVFLVGKFIKLFLRKAGTTIYEAVIGPIRVEVV